MTIKARVATTHKIAAIVLGASTLTILTGCGSSSTSSAAETTTIHVLMEQGVPPKVLKPFLNKVVNGFEKTHPHIKVDLSTYPLASTSTTVDTMIASHRGPNVFEIGTTFIPTLTASRAFVPWTTTMLKEGGIKNFVPASTRMDAVPGHRPIGLPDSASPFVLWYNKAMFKAAHITSPPTTWNQFLHDAKILNHPASGVWGAAIAPGDPFYSMHLTWLLARQLGGQVINSAGTKAEFASPKVEPAVKFYLDLLKKYHVVSPSDVQYDEQDMITAFMEGKAAMVPVGGVYDLPILKSAPSFLKHDVGAAPNPTIPFGYSHLPPGGVPAETFVSGQEQVIFKYGSSPAQINASVQWIAYYDSAQNQYEMWKTYGDLPVNKGSYHYSALSTPLWKSFETIEQHAYPTPRVPGWLAMPTVFDKSLAVVFDDVALKKYTHGELSRTLKSIDAQIDSSLAGLKTP